MPGHHATRLPEGVRARWLYAILIQAIVILEEEHSIEKMPPPDQPVDKPLGHFLDQ